MYVVELYSRPLDDYACLTIARISPQADHTPNDVIPFTLHRLVSREYHVGKGGVVIGTGSKCSVRLPTETGLQEQHVAIEWISGKAGITMSLAYRCNLLKPKIGQNC